MFPTFVLGFLAFALLRTIGWLPNITFSLEKSMIWGTSSQTIKLADLCDALSKFLIVASMAAVGLETSVKSLRQTGMRPFLLGLTASIIICGVILIAILAAHV